MKIYEVKSIVETPVSDSYATDITQCDVVLSQTADDAISKVKDHYNSEERHKYISTESVIAVTKLTLL